MRIVGPSLAVVLGAVISAAPDDASAATSPIVVAVDGDDAAAGARATLTANLSVSDARPAAVGADTASSGNSWDIGGTWNDAAVISTDTGPITGARGAVGSLPSSPAFLVPRNGAAVGARL
ncbi:hypothetical protein ACWCQM_33535 [Streptomyces sp. NPDC002125]